MGKGHSGATRAHVKDGLLFQRTLRTWRWNCHARFPGLCYVWNQTRWSLLALKFSYSKILSHFPFSLNVRNISSQSPATFLVQLKRASLFCWENSEVISLLWDLLLFVTHSLSHKKRKCLSQNPLSPTRAQLFRVPCENGSQLFSGSCILLQTRNPSICVCCLPLFELGGLTWARFWVA